MRNLAGNLNRTQTLCLFVNEIREKTGVMKVVKNKVARPFHEAEFGIEFGDGISTSALVSHLALETRLAARVYVLLLSALSDLAATQGA